MTEPPAKKRRLTSEDASTEREPPRHHQDTPASLTHAISPPRRKRRSPDRQYISSPFQLTTVRDVPPESNVGAVSLHDLLADPLIAECWEFNYLHDVEFLMSHFDPDTRSLVKVHLIHGFWKNEDPNRLSLKEQASNYSNVTLHPAYMPEMFGTHHSKMLVLVRHDDTAQVIIHTANMISKDWTNMTNGAWQSPMLPLLTGSETSNQVPGRIGSGSRFKADLLNYLGAYNTRRNVCKPLVEQLQKHDFSAVRGALVASVPGKHAIDREPDATRWGWAGLKHVLRHVPVAAGKSEVVLQISSIATLGGTDTWLRRTLFDAFSASSTVNTAQLPNFKVVFPTPDEIRRSLDGYASGGSIHTKVQSAAQAKQLRYLRPLLHHWANDSEKGISEEEHAEPRDAGRNRAAPHIKTYIRYGERESIDWVLLTSANISKQAWGEAVNAGRQVRIASWEIGVLVWPALLASDDQNARMVPTFKTDVPTAEDDNMGLEDSADKRAPVVGLRMPYNLPLQRYGDEEVPWVATASYPEPDWMGNKWSGW